MTQKKGEALELLDAFVEEGRIRGLTGEEILEEAIWRGLLKIADCRECEGEGCSMCVGYGVIFLVTAWVEQ